MRVVDTSAWIEVLIGTATGKRVAPLLPRPEAWLVPAIVQLELAKWLTREVSEERSDLVIGFTQLCTIAPLDTNIALAAAELCRNHKLATADAIVYATAREYDADLVTCDAHFDRLTGVTFVAKDAGET